jgi:hypothetical protein
VLEDHEREDPEHRGEPVYHGNWLSENSEPGKIDSQPIRVTSSKIKRFTMIDFTSTDL